MATNHVIHATPELNEEELEAIAKITALQTRLRTVTHEPRRWAGKMRRQAQAANIRGSSMIEGFIVSVEDAEAIVDGRITSESVDHHAVRAYQQTMTYVLQAARDPNFRYWSEALKVMQFMVTEFDLDAYPGRFREGSVFVTDTATGAVRYTGPDVELVPDLVAALCDHLNTPLTSEPMVDAAMAHLNLVNIHPFKDGNGRMSRILQTLVLARAGTLVPEFASIEEYLGNYTQGYYRILGSVGGEHWSPERDARPWVRYCLTAHHIQAHSVVRKLARAERLWDLLEAAAAASAVDARAAAGLHDAAHRKRVSNSSYLEAVESATGDPISKKTATNDLGRLVAAGLLEARGSGRTAHYVGTDAVIGLAAQADQEIAADPVPGLFA